LWQLRQILSVGRLLSEACVLVGALA